MEKSNFLLSMAEFNIPKTEEGFCRNFEQIKPLMNTTEAFYESSRCLFCYDAPCVKACPASIDIPLFIRQIHTNNIFGAAKTIYESNYLGNACGKVCPTEVLCEGVCVFKKQKIKSLEIGRLQTFATTTAIVHNKKLFAVSENKRAKVAVIGAGPAGIACACELRLHGYLVDIYEEKAQPSGLLIHGVAPYKIENLEITTEINYLQSIFGFTVHYNSPIKTKTDLQKLEKTYSAIFLGIGLGNTRSLNIRGEDLKNCIGATEFIEQLKLNRLTTGVGKKVVVLGGGNTAMDAASNAARMGAEAVILAYRGNKAEMKAYHFEYELAKNVGVKAIFNVMPIAITGNGQVSGVKFQKTQTQNGKLQPVAGSEFSIDCDMVIKATGQKKQTDFLKLIDNLKLDDLGRIVTQAENGQTTNPKYFAGGDARNGGTEVVNAAAEGKLAAKGIVDFLKKM